MRDPSVSDRDQLLASILAQPGEDTPRLALADWLDEYGGCADRARAEFIRLQIERSRRGDEAPTGAKERALFAQWAYEWLPPFGDATHSHLRAWHPTAPLTIIRTPTAATELIDFDRGFPARYLLVAHGGRLAERFAKRAGALFAVAPVERFEMEVENCEPWVDLRVGADAGSWRAEIYVRAGQPLAGPFDELRAPDRQSLADGFERWVRKALADICFEVTDETEPRRRVTPPRAAAAPASPTRPAAGR